MSIRIKTPAPPGSKKKRSRRPRDTKRSRRKAAAGSPVASQKKRSTKKATGKKKSAKKASSKKKLSKKKSTGGRAGRPRTTTKHARKFSPVAASQADAPLTEAQTRQLIILGANPDITPAEFARKAWPEAEGWKKICRAGAGRNHKDEYHEVEGGAMNITAGAALGKLFRAGLAEYIIPAGKRGRYYKITMDGEKALARSRKLYGI
jgi:hypothetical protein